MKKLLVMLLALVICFSLSACVADSAPSKEIASGESNSSDTTETTEKDDTFKINETAVFENLKFTATELKESTGGDFFKPEAGNIYVGIKFTVENISDEEQSISSLLLFDGYVDDTKRDYSFVATSLFGEDTLDGDIAPGKKLEGWYGMEIPADWAKIEINVKTDLLSDTLATFVFEK